MSNNYIIVLANLFFFLYKYKVMLISVSALKYPFNSPFNVPHKIHFWNIRKESISVTVNEFNIVPIFSSATLLSCLKLEKKKKKNNNLVTISGS